MTEKYTSIPNFKIQSSHKDSFANMSSKFIPCSPDKPSRRVPTIIPYNKQSKRFEYIKEKGIDKHYESDSSLLKKKIMTIDMGKTLGRKKFLFNPPTESSTMYEANKEVLMEDLGKVMSFDGMSKRKDLFLINDTPDPYDINFSSILPNEKSFSLSKQSKLLKNADCSLPSFMQSVHNRFSICFSSMKSINMSSSLNL